MAKNRLAEVSPASSVVDVGNQVYDLNNISGKKRAQLAMIGATSPAQFISPPNMPGAKLAALRAQAEKENEKSMKKVKEEVEAKFSEKLEVGSLVTYEGFQTEIIDLKKVKKGKKKVTKAFITKKSGKKVWVPILALSLLEVKEDIDDED